VKKEYSPCSPTEADSCSELENCSELDNESGSSAAEDEKQNRPLSHQQAMEQFKDALAEMIVVCY